MSKIVTACIRIQLKDSAFQYRIICKHSQFSPFSFNGLLFSGAIAVVRKLLITKNVSDWIRVQLNGFSKHSQFSSFSFNGLLFSGAIAVVPNLPFLYFDDDLKFKDARTL